MNETERIISSLYEQWNVIRVMIVVLFVKKQAYVRCSICGMRK